MEAYAQRNQDLSDIVNTLVSVAKESVINVNEELIRSKCNVEDE